MTRAQLVDAIVYRLEDAAHTEANTARAHGELRVRDWHELTLTEIAHIRAALRKAANIMVTEDA